MVHFTCQRKLTVVFSLQSFWFVHFLGNSQVLFMLVADSHPSAQSQPLWTFPVSPAAGNQRVHFQISCRQGSSFNSTSERHCRRFGRWWRNRSHGLFPMVSQAGGSTKASIRPLWITHTRAPGSWDRWWWGLLIFITHLKLWFYRVLSKSKGTLLV